MIPRADKSNRVGSVQNHRIDQEACKRVKMLNKRTNPRGDRCRISV